VLPSLLTLGIALAAVRLVGGAPTSPHAHAQGIVWGDRTFVNRAAFARWLESRGRSYQAWAQRHPVAPPVAKPKGQRSSSRGSTTMMLGGVAALAALGLAVLLRRRLPAVRVRPRLGFSYERAHTATLVAWHEHPDLVWYVAGGALAVGAGLAIAGWS